jgi:hypothetical protein
VTSNGASDLHREALGHPTWGGIGVACPQRSRLCVNASRGRSWLTRKISGAGEPSLWLRSLSLAPRKRQPGGAQGWRNDGPRNNPSPEPVKLQGQHLGQRAKGLNAFHFLNVLRDLPLLVSQCNNATMMQAIQMPQQSQTPRETLVCYEEKRNIIIQWPPRCRAPCSDDWLATTLTPRPSFPSAQCWQ